MDTHDVVVSIVVAVVDGVFLFCCGANSLVNSILFYVLCCDAAAAAVSVAILLLQYLLEPKRCSDTPIKCIS